MRTRLRSFLLLLVLVGSLQTRAVFAAPLLQQGNGDQHFIVVRLDRVTVLDDQDPIEQGEIVYLATVATGNRGEEPIVTQRTGFPMEQWYEAEDGGGNATFMADATGNEQALPIFAFPEDEMGDELVINLTVVDDDTTSGVVITGHRIAGVVGTAIATWMAGPGAGGLVGGVSSAVQEAIEDGSELDLVDTYTNRFRQSRNFGIPAGRQSVSFEHYGEDRGMLIKYRIMRVSVPQEYDDWCVSVTLNRVRVMENSDNWGGEIYIRARAADGYIGELFDQDVTRLGERDVDDGDDYPLPRRGRQLYFNQCQGLPPFLYVEVGVWDDDSPEDPQMLGILPLMYTNPWLREHSGSYHPGTNGRSYYQVAGSDPDDRKARIYLTIDVWDPHGVVW